jgi:predicted phage terminase large subunit-like protein
MSALHLRHPSLPAQARFWRAPDHIRIFMGGLGSGKTTAGAVEILRQPARSLGIVLAPTYRALQDASQRTFLEIATRAEAKGAAIIAHHSESRQETHLINGTIILWRTAMHPDRLRGVNATWAWLDEAGQVDEEVWRIILGRLRVGTPRAWITTTPVGAQHWTAKLAAHVTRARTRDNVHLPAEYVERLEATYDERWRRQELEGEVVDWSGGLIRTHRIRIVSPDAVPSDLRWVRAWDLAASERTTADETASVRAARHPDGTLYLAAPISLRAAWPDARARIVQTAAAERAIVREVSVEQVASWRTVVDDLRRDAVWSGVTLKAIHPQGDKVARASPWAALAEAGRVVLVQDPAWPSWMDQWAGFPSGRHDDRVDAVSLACEALIRGGSSDAPILPMAPPSARKVF